MAPDWVDTTHIQLRVESWSDATRTVELRGVCKGGPFAENHTTNSNRSLASNTYEMHGLPQFLSLNPSTGPVRPGQCYVRVTLMVEGEPVHILTTGYLTDGKNMTWPPGVHEGFGEGPGYLDEIKATDPAAGAEMESAVPANEEWELMTFNLELVTDATVINRLPQLVIWDGTDIYFKKAMGGNHAASTTVRYFGAQGVDVDASGNPQMMNLPQNMRIPQGCIIRTTTNDLQAGDDYGRAVMLVRTWVVE